MVYEKFPGPTITELERWPISAGSATRASETHPDVNEDVVLVNTEKRFFGVFDGVSGTKGDHSGADASRLVKHVLEQALLQAPENLSLEETKSYIYDALGAANEEVRQAIKNNPFVDQMATTASIVQLKKTEEGSTAAVIANNGDSRVYVYREGRLIQLTVDHNGMSMESQQNINSAHDFTQLSVADQEHFKQRNRITKAVGFSSESDVNIVDLLPGDRLLLTSDGIHDNLSSGEIAQWFDGRTDQEIADGLLIAAHTAAEHSDVNIRGKHDDMSAVVITVGEIKIDNASKKEFEFIKEGQPIRIKRSPESGGQIEDGWYLYVNQSNGGLKAVKPGYGEKSVTLEELKEWNS